MKYLLSSLLFISIYSCSNTSPSDAESYFKNINNAELLICEEQFKEAVASYILAFEKNQKPFGKDLFNAALCAQLSNQFASRNKYLQKIINNSDDLNFVSSQFLGTYLTTEEWDQLLSNRQIDYDPALRNEFVRIQERDQLFRPMYDTHDDTIDRNRIINLTRILNITDSIGFPSHVELGYTNYLRGQNHDIVLHHTAQRRSRDKSVLDLEPILHKAVKEGRFDPETAILYMNFQSDLEKAHFEVYSTWQHIHHSLPDSLNNKVWLIDLNDKQAEEANAKRKQWLANSLEDIAVKAKYLSKSSFPFIFTGVRKSVGHLRDDLDSETALEQYKIGTSFMKEYKP